MRILPVAPVIVGRSYDAAILGSFALRSQGVRATHAGSSQVACTPRPANRGGGEDDQLDRYRVRLCHRSRDRMADDSHDDTPYDSQPMLSDPLTALGADPRLSTTARAYFRRSVIRKHRSGTIKGGDRMSAGRQAFCSSAAGIKHRLAGMPTKRGISSPHGGIEPCPFPAGASAGCAGGLTSHARGRRRPDCRYVAGRNRDLSSNGTVRAAMAYACRRRIAGATLVPILAIIELRRISSGRAPIA